MKRFLAVLCCLTLILAMALPAAAADPAEGNVLYEHREDLGDGIVLVERVVELPGLSRASGSRTASKTRSYYSFNTLIAEITITATFSYTGSKVTVTSKSVDSTATYNGWAFHQSSILTTGGGSTGSVTLKGSLKKGSLTPITVELVLSCDANGNIS